MAESSLTRARARADALRADSARARARRASRHGTAADQFTSITVDEMGQLVRLEFAHDVVDAGPDRWASSLLAMHRRACEDVTVPPVGPADRFSPQAAGRSGRTAPTPDMPVAGRPLAPEQQETRRATEAMVDRLARFSADQGALRITGSADDQLWLEFDGALQLLAARATPTALQGGPTALADAVGRAWDDARRQLTSRIGLVGQEGTR